MVAASVVQGHYSNSSGEQHLLQREASGRHFVFRQWQCFLESPFGAIPSSRLLDHCIFNGCAEWSSGPPLTQRLRERVCAHHAQPNLWFLSHHAQSQRGGVGHERGRCPQVHHLNGRGGTWRPRCLASQSRDLSIRLNWLNAN